VLLRAKLREGFLLRTERWAYLQYGEDASRGRELYDLASDPGQYVNLALDPDHAERVAELQSALAARLAAARDCDLDP
jgi:iduronate 2-sulfatase